MTGTILLNELRMVLRDTRTVLIAVVAPLVLFPAVLFAMNWVEERETRRLETRTYSFALIGDGTGLGEHVLSAALALEATEDAGAGPGGIAGLPARGGGDGREEVIRPARFERVTTANPAPLLESGELHLLIVVRQPVPEDSLPGAVPVLEMRYRANSDFSRNARARMEERILAVRSDMRDSVFQAAGFPLTLKDVAVVESQNVASPAREGGALLGGTLLPFLIVLMLSGGSIVAADSISGEKERGTLETLLTTASSRQDIVHAKLGAVMAVGLAVSLINIANIGVYIGLGVIELPENFRIAVGPDTLAILLVLTVPLVVTVAASLLLLSGLAKSYQEYQLYFLPAFLVILAPSLATFLPGVELASAIAFVPVSGLAVATRALLTGDWHFLWGGVAFASTASLAWLLLVKTEAALSNERLITSAGLDEAEFVGGAAVFPRHVLRWFVGFWVVFFIVNLWFGEVLGLKGQVAVNLGVIFLGGSVFLIRRYGLDPRETLQLHAPHWTAWPAVLIGAPSVLVLALGLFEVVNRYVFPVPESLLEAFGRSILEDMSLWQLILFVTVMPGILEELAFRGVLLSGLREHLRRPWLAVVLSAAVFAVFHVSLFRIVPTGFLGIVLAVVVLRTGSVFPAMLWHFLNNFLSVVPQTLGWITLDRPEDRAPWWYGLAAVCALASWTLMRERPGQQPPKVGGRE